MQYLKEFKSKANREIVRKARVRFDVFAMHIWRSFISTVCPEDIDIFLYVDGSPQHRGKELYASIVDIFTRRSGNTEVYHRLLPVISLG